MTPDPTPRTACPHCGLTLRTDPLADGEFCEPGDDYNRTSACYERELKEARERAARLEGEVHDLLVSINASIGVTGLYSDPGKALAEMMRILGEAVGRSEALAAGVKINQ